VQASQGQQLAEKWQGKFIETSAKTGENIDKAFSTLIRYLQLCLLFVCCSPVLQHDARQRQAPACSHHSCIHPQRSWLHYFVIGNTCFSLMSHVY
jgi:hypothetical protein